MKNIWVFVFLMIVNLLGAQEMLYEINSAAANMTTESSRLNWSLGSVLDYDYMNEDLDLSNPWLYNNTHSTPNNNGNFIIYPNPSSGNVYVCVDSYLNLPYKILIYNINGMKVLEKDMTSNIETISVYSLSRGMYFFEYIKDGKRIGISKMLKE